MPTPIDSSLRTGWVAIATEGDTVDGRQIPAQWIVDMAETYDTETYRALLWPEHFHWAENMGDVIELKHEKVNGKETLFAVLSPTRDLVYQNSRNQYKFCSIEPEHDFAGTGKTYLTGLGVTNQPASLGTTALRFSAGKNTPLIGQSQPLDLSGVDAVSPCQEPESMGLAQQFFRFLARHGDATAPTRQDPRTVTDEENDDMKEEQFTALNATLKSIGDKMEIFSTKVDAIGKPAEVSAVDPVVKPVAVVPVAGAEVTAEQFSAFEQTLKGLGDQLNSLNDKIEKFSVEAPNQRPDALGGSDTNPTVC